MHCLWLRKGKIRTFFQYSVYMYIIIQALFFCPDLTVYIRFFFQLLNMKVVGEILLHYLTSLITYFLLFFA